MDQLRIEGGLPLQGEVAISGAKNAALPALAATLLTAEAVTLDRIPRVRDIRTMVRLLENTGAEVAQDGGSLRIQAADVHTPEAPYELVKTMRASSLVLGPLLARTGRARVSLPGGCAIGARPINLHLSGLTKLGAEIHQEHGYVEARAPEGLRGTTYRFERISVTGTEDLVMAATLAEGETVIENAAREPEVTDTIDLLHKMGAVIEGAGTSTLRIQGMKSLGGAAHAIIPDRVEAATYLIAAALVGGDMTVAGLDTGHIESLLEKLKQAGANVISVRPGAVRVEVPAGLRAVDIVTQEHPGFATDMQAQWMALMTQADGESNIVETIFENRFMHVSELGRMGADIELDGNRARVRGPRQLSGATVMCSDLRASACLVLAALCAKGVSTLDRVYHIDRGYERIEEKLRGLGASIERVAS